MPKSKAQPRRQRRHGDLPAGFKWRDGRPRWEPSPTRRGQGWKGCDLKNAWGKWLPKGEAITRAEALAGAVAAWAAGEPVAPGFANIAPAGALSAGAALSSLNPRSIGALLDAYFAGDKFKRLAGRTQSDYRSKLKRFLETVAGAADPAKVAKLKALDVDVLLPPGFNEPGDFEIELAYDALRESAGEHMAHGVMATVSAWLSWCVKKKRIWPSNPAELVERSTPDGRIEVFEWPELVALVRAAEARGLPSIADAIVLAVDLSWSQQDLLALNWGQISADGHVKHRRIKTGVAGNPPLLAIGNARLELIRARWAPEKVRPTHVLICELTGKPWAADTFRHHFAEIRAAAAKEMASLAAKQFRDTRDTTVTYCIEGGLTLEETCSRTLHAPVRAQAVISKHYGAIRQGVTDGAAAKLDAHYKKMGYTFEEQLALPAPGQG
jgi:hypothetical protein